MQTKAMLATFMGVALLCATVSIAQESGLPIVESAAQQPILRSASGFGRFNGARAASEVGISLTCRTGQKSPATVREALGPNVKRLLIHSYDNYWWRDWASAAAYVGKVLNASAENRQLYTFQVFSEHVTATISGSVEMLDGSLRPMEFAAGYAHVMGENGCEWWARYTADIPKPPIAVAVAQTSEVLGQVTTAGATISVALASSESGSLVHLIEGSETKPNLERRAEVWALLAGSCSAKLLERLPETATRTASDRRSEAGPSQWNLVFHFESSVRPIAVVVRVGSTFQVFPVQAFP